MNRRSSFAISLVVHAAVFALAFFIARQPPVATIAKHAVENYADVVWLPASGPGGGGGGGGNGRAGPIRKLEVQGQDDRTMPASKPPDTNPAETTPAENRDLSLVIPAVDAGVADLTQIGVAEGIPSSDSLGPGKRNGAGSRNEGDGIGPGDGDGLGPGRNRNIGDGDYRPGSGIVNPRVLREVKPLYTAQAMQMKIQGDVHLECVVQSDGTVGEIRVVRSLDWRYGLDQEAIKAARQWLFVPAMLKGRPVAMRVTIGITFALR